MGLPVVPTIQRSPATVNDVMSQAALLSFVHEEKHAIVANRATATKYLLVFVIFF